MKTLITFIDNTTDKPEIVCQIIEWQNEEQKKWLMENFINQKTVIYIQDINGFCYLQYRNKNV